MGVTPHELDAAVKAFSRGFYQSLARGNAVPFAAAFAAGRGTALVLDVGATVGIYSPLAAALRRFRATARRKKKDA